MVNDLFIGSDHQNPTQVLDVFRKFSLSQSISVNELYHWAGVALESPCDFGSISHAFLNGPSLETSIQLKCEQW